MTKIKYISLIIIIPIFILVYFTFKSDCPSYGKLLINNHSLDIEYACSIYKQTKGLSDRDSILPNQGMFFVFDKSSVRSFTSEDIKIPLSIGFIDERGLLIELHTMNPMQPKIITSSTPILYAIEAPINWFQERDIRIGDRIYIKE